MLNLVDVYDAISRERDYQDKKWGNLDQHPHTISEWLWILHTEFKECVDKALLNEHDPEVLSELLQVVSVGVACLQQHGLVERLRVPTEPFEFDPLANTMNKSMPDRDRYCEAMLCSYLGSEFATYYDRCVCYNHAKMLVNAGLKLDGVR